VRGATQENYLEDSEGTEDPEGEATETPFDKLRAVSQAERRRHREEVRRQKTEYRIQKTRRSHFRKWVPKLLRVETGSI
jgi:hypothetical protein